MAGRCRFQRTNITCGLPPAAGVAVVCAGDAVCTGAVVAVSFGAGVEVAAGAFVLATGAAGSVRFGVCATGFGSVFTVACGFSVQSPPADELGA